MKTDKVKTISIKISRWILRLWSGFIIAFSLFWFISETFFADYGNPKTPMNAGEIFGLSIAGLILLGLGLAWKWELIGGIIALVACIVMGISVPGLLQVHVLLIIPVTAMLFIVLWAISRNTTVIKNESENRL